MNRVKRKIYEIEFWDHAYSNDGNMGAVKCRVIGYLVKSDTLSHYICSWFDEESGVSDVYSILKSAIIKMRKIA